MTDLCAAADRCVDRRSEEPGLAEDGPLCEGCLSAGEWAVNALVRDYADLEQHLPPSLGVWGDGQPASRDDHPVPLNLAVEELQRVIWWVLTTWEEVVREREKLSDSVTRGVRAGWAVQAAVQILQPRVRLLAKIPPVLLADYPGLDEDERWHHAGVELADVPGWRGVVDFRRLHDRAQRLQGLLREYPQICWGVICRECDLVNTVCREPVRREGDPVVYRCGSCGLVYDENEYDRWVGLLAEHARPREVA
jgi:hypothetical protein